MSAPPNIDDAVTLLALGSVPSRDSKDFKPSTSLGLKTTGVDKKPESSSISDALEALASPSTPSSASGLQVLETINVVMSKLVADHPSSKIDTQALYSSLVLFPRNVPKIEINSEVMVTLRIDYNRVPMSIGSTFMPASGEGSHVFLGGCRLRPRGERNKAFLFYVVPENKQFDLRHVDRSQIRIIRYSALSSVVTGVVPHINEATVGNVARMLVERSIVSALRTFSVWSLTRICSTSKTLHRS